MGLLQLEPVCRPGADARYLGEGGLDLLVGHASERPVCEPPVDEVFGERAQRRAPPRREPAGAKNLRIGLEQLRGRGQVSSEMLLEARQDGSGRPDGQLFGR